MELVGLWVARFRGWQLSRYRETYRKAKLASSVMVPEPEDLSRATFLREHL